MRSLLIASLLLFLASMGSATAAGDSSPPLAPLHSVSSLCDIPATTWSQAQLYEGQRVEFNWYLNPCQLGNQQANCSTAGFLQQFGYGGSCQMTMGNLAEFWHGDATAGYTALLADSNGRREARITITCDVFAGNLAPAPNTDVVVTSTSFGHLYEMQLVSSRVCGSGDESSSSSTSSGGASEGHTSSSGTDSPAAEPAQSYPSKGGKMFDCDGQQYTTNWGQCCSVTDGEKFCPWGTMCPTTSKSQSCVTPQSLLTTADGPKPQPRRPDANKFVHYAFKTKDMKNGELVKRDDLANSAMYNPKMEFGGASIFADNDGMDAVGWDVVYIQTERYFTGNNTERAFYAAGFVEGAETQHRIYQNFVNIYPPTDSNKTWNSEKICPAQCQDWIWAQFNWIKTESAKRKNDAGQDGAFWTSVGHSVAQIEGMMDGYNSTAPASEALNWMQVYLVGFNFELEDVYHQYKWNATHKSGPVWPITPSPASGDGDHDMEDFNTNNEKDEARAATPSKKSLDQLEQREDPLRASRCSALVKVTKDDLFMAHDTWSTFATMLRQYKTYEFGNDTIPTIAMSSYPGTLHSGDDWYMLSNGLSVQETTNGNLNPENAALALWNSVPEFVRVMVSHRISKNGYEWTSTFCKHNSGTYNNQFMVVNHNLFNKTEKDIGEMKTPNGTLFIVEQMPLLCVYADVTTNLQKDSYWASYNLPYFEATYKGMNYTFNREYYGDFYSYTQYARPKIFAARQGNITDLEGMKYMMRYNDYQHDPNSLITNCSGTTGGKCDPPFNPTLTIAARADLDPKNMSHKVGGPLWSYFKPFAFGAIDSKIVGYSGMMTLEGHVISGPTTSPYSPQPAFQWSTSAWASRTHEGQPDKWDFAFQNSTELATGPMAKKDQKEVPKNRLWVLAVVLGLVILCVVASVAYKKYQDKSAEGTGRYSELNDDKTRV